MEVRGKQNKSESSGKRQEQTESLGGIGCVRKNSH